MSDLKAASLALEPLRTSNVALVTSYKRDGSGVGTPVGIQVGQDTAHFMTRAKTWKVKRMARNPRVTVAPCDRRGRVLGEPDACSVECFAELVPNDTMVGLGSKIWRLVYAVFYRDAAVTYRLTPVLGGAADGRAGGQTP